MRRLQNTLIGIAVSMLVEWASGCVGPVSEPSTKHPSLTSDSATVTTGTATPHPQTDSPVKTERVTSEMLEQAGATHVGQSLQDVPGIQLRR